MQKSQDITDLELLIESLDIIEKELGGIVHRRTELFRKSLLVHFEDETVWGEVQNRLHFARGELRREINALESRQARLSYEYQEGAGLIPKLEEVGLTGPSLWFKCGLLRQTAREGVIGRFLKVVNSFLGSFQTVIPGLHVVKEFKEQVEAAFKFNRRWDRDKESDQA